MGARGGTNKEGKLSPRAMKSVPVYSMSIGGEVETRIDKLDLVFVSHLF